MESFGEKLGQFLFGPINHKSMIIILKFCVNDSFLYNRSMLIGIDGNEANIGKRVGVNVYAFELLCAIWRLQNEWKARHRLIVYLKDPPLDDLPQETPFFKYEVLPSKGVWIITRLMPHLFATYEKPDILFTPSHYVPPFAPMPRVCSIMDLAYLKFSEQFRIYDFWQLKYWTAISIFLSKRVIAISNSTKQDIVRHYHFASKKTVVTHLGYDKEHFNINIKKEDVRRIYKKYAIVGDYILFLSTLKPSKNVEGLLEAFGRILNANQRGNSRNIVVSKYPNIKLVIAGKKGWLYSSIYEKVKELGLKDKVIFTDYVPEEDKPALIAGAKVFVLPSFWEGFGLDVLNAMACGVPVIVSKVGSLPEVAGDAAFYLDPQNIESIRSGIEKVLSMSKLEYNRQIDMGLKQAEKFSWEKTARETLKVLEEAAT